MVRANACLRLSAVTAAAALWAGCAGTSISGRVVNPDGSALTREQVRVYTSPRSSVARANKSGAYKLSKNVMPGYEYTVIAEDKEGNMGYVRGFTPRKGENKGVIVRLSREVEAKDAALEGVGPAEGGNGIGEKILKSSQ